MPQAYVYITLPGATQAVTAKLTHAAIFLVFLGAFFPIVINTTFGVKSVEPRLFEAAEQRGAAATMNAWLLELAADQLGDAVTDRRPDETLSRRWRPAQASWPMERKLSPRWRYRQVRSQPWLPRVLRAFWPPSRLSFSWRQFRADVFRRSNWAWPRTFLGGEWTASVRAAD